MFLMSLCCGEMFDQTANDSPYPFRYLPDAPSRYLHWIHQIVASIPRSVGQRPHPEIHSSTYLLQSNQIHHLRRHWILHVSPSPGFSSPLVPARLSFSHLPTLCQIALALNSCPVPHPDTQFSLRLTHHDPQRQRYCYRNIASAIILRRLPSLPLSLLHHTRIVENNPTNSRCRRCPHIMLHSFQRTLASTPRCIHICRLHLSLGCSKPSQSNSRRTLLLITS